MIISTYPNKKSVIKMANRAVEKHLAACVNFTKISSVYTWQKKIENAGEFLAIFKTTTRKKELLKREIKKTHPYKIPEIMELKVISVNKPYHEWLVDSTN